MRNVWYTWILLLASAALVARAADVCVSSVIAVDECPREILSSSIKAQAAISRAGVHDSKHSTQRAMEGNAPPFIARPASLAKQQNRITDVIKRSRTLESQSFAPISTDRRWRTPPQGDMNGASLLQDYGLHVMPTPATGNCQYYAIAMALLDISFDTPQHVETLERMTQLVKNGIAEASRHGYEVEFPHDIRQAVLATNLLEVHDLELATTMSERESDLLFREYIDAIAQSPSDISAVLPFELWGTEVSLRMLAKLLQQPIFVIIAPHGLDPPPSYYQVYEPERITRAGRELESAEEYFIPSSEPHRWTARLETACEEPSSMSNPPIVLLYSHSHYSRVNPHCSIG